MKSHVYADDAERETNETDSVSSRGDSRDSDEKTVKLKEILPTEGDTAGGPAPPDDPGSNPGEITQESGDGTYECLTCGRTMEHYSHHCAECGGTAFKRRSPTTESEEKAGSKVASRAADLTAKLNPYVPR